MRVVDICARSRGAVICALLFLGFESWSISQIYGQLSLLSWIDILNPIPLFIMAIAISAKFCRSALAVIVVVICGQLLYTFPLFSFVTWYGYFAIAPVVFFVAYNGARSTRWAALVVALGSAAAIGVLLTSRQYSGGIGVIKPPSNWPGTIEMLGVYAVQVSTFMIISVVPWLLGMFLRSVRERALLSAETAQTKAKLQNAEVELVVTQERNRIARDLHDVLAHSLAVVVAQADGARYIGSLRPEAVERALTEISNAARNALINAQNVIDDVRRGDVTAPQPELAELPALLRDMRDSGLLLHREDRGTPGEFAGIQQLAIYRIFQESLTNVLKHGGRGSSVTIRCDWEGDGLALMIRSSSPQLDQVLPSLPGTGRGIPGMQERAVAAGGSLSAAPDGTGFKVSAFVPYPEASEASGRVVVTAGNTAHGLPSVSNGTL